MRLLLGAILLSISAHAFGQTEQQSQALPREPPASDEEVINQALELAGHARALSDSQNYAKALPLWLRVLAVVEKFARQSTTSSSTRISDRRED
ncbi:hypothetical protein EBZ37_05805 [bacterium]|nr:hypothetical protein [bacterium]